MAFIHRDQTEPSLKLMELTGGGYSLEDADLIHACVIQGQPQAVKAWGAMRQADPGAVRLVEMIT